MDVIMGSLGACFQIWLFIARRNYMSRAQGYIAQDILSVGFKFAKIGLVPQLW